MDFPIHEAERFSSFKN